MSIILTSESHSDMINELKEGGIITVSASGFYDGDYDGDYVVIKKVDFSRIKLRKCYWFEKVFLQLKRLYWSLKGV